MSMLVVVEYVCQLIDRSQLSEFDKDCRIADLLRMGGQI